MSAGFEELEAQLVERMKSTSDLAAPFHSIQANVGRAVEPDELVIVVRDAYSYLKQVKYETSDDLAFSGPAVTLISATSLLIARARLPAILFRFDQDPDAIKSMAEVDLEEGGFFGSSDVWYREIVGVIHYLGPLLGCLSPRFWCLPPGRAPRALLFSLGIDLNGLRSSPMELMQLLPGFGRDEPIAAIDITPTSCRRAIHRRRVV
jgi:hypothetical protein